MTCFIFDLDGTLVDTIPLHIESGLYALRKYGLNFVDPKDVRDEIGKSFHDIVLDICRKYNIPISEELIKDIWQIKHLYFLKNIHKVKLLPGVLELLEFLRNNHSKIALASSSPKDSVKAILDHFNLWGYFDVVLTADDVSKAKPDPEIFLRAKEKLGCNDCIVIEDSLYGVIAGKKAGCKVYAVLTGVGKRKDLEKYADKVFRDLTELLSWVSKQL